MSILYFFSGLGKVIFSIKKIAKMSTTIAKRNLNRYYESIGMYYDFINSIMFLKYRPLILLIDKTQIEEYKGNEKFYLNDINTTFNLSKQLFEKITSINNKNFFKLFYEDKNTLNTQFLWDFSFII